MYLSKKLAAPMILATLLVACGTGSDQTSNTSLSDGQTGTPPTHDLDEASEVLFTSKLQGNLDCLWTEDPDGTLTPLVLPRGHTTSRDGDNIVLLNQDGQQVAQTGDIISHGGSPSSETPCLDSPDAEPPLNAVPIAKATPVEIELLESYPSETQG